MKIAVLGTGQMGTALGAALARAGVPLVVGSRDAARAEAHAEALRTSVPGARVTGADHLRAVSAADVVVLAVDFTHALELLPALRDALRGKIVVDPTTPWDDQPPPTSGAAELARLLPPGTPLVAAWKTTFAGELSSAGPGGGGDVLVCGDDAAAKVAVASFVRATGLRALDCGGLEHAATLEGMTRMMGPIVRNLGLAKGTVPAFRLATIPPAR